MEQLKFFLISVFLLGILGVGGYWAVLNIQSGTEYVSADKLKKLEAENLELKERTEKLEKEIFSKELSKEEVETKEEVNEEKEEDQKTYKNQVLIDEVQKLANEKVVLKRGMKGERVGVVQKFLNLYNNKISRIDNDFGATTERLIKEFQNKEELKETGEVGELDFRNMIEWLKTQG